MCYFGRRGNLWWLTATSFREDAPGVPMVKELASCHDAHTFARSDLIGDIDVDMRKLAIVGKVTW